MAGSKSSNIFSVLSFAAAATLIIMFLSVLHIPKAQAQDTTIVAGQGTYTEDDQAKCSTYLAGVPGYKGYCKGFLEPSSPSPSSSSIELGEWSQDLEECWSSLKKIDGCVGDIFYALFHGNDFSKIGHQCCQAIEALESLAFECLLQMFPWSSSFPTLIIDFCKTH